MTFFENEPLKNNATHIEEEKKPGWITEWHEKGFRFFFHSDEYDFGSQKHQEAESSLKNSVATGK